MFEVAIPEGTLSPDSIPGPTISKARGASSCSWDSKRLPETSFAVRGGVVMPTRRGLPAVRPPHHVTFPQRCDPWGAAAVECLVYPHALSWHRLGARVLLQAAPALFLRVVFFPSRRSDRQGEELPPQDCLVFQARRGCAPEPPLAGGLLLRRLQHLHALPEPLETGESPAGTP